MKEIPKEYIALMKRYKDKWEKIGLSTENVSREYAKEKVKLFYRKILDKEMVPLLIVDGPLMVWVSISLLMTDNVDNPSFVDEIKKVKGFLRGEISSDEVCEVVKGILNSDKKNYLKNFLLPYVRPYIDGFTYLPWLAYFDFMREIIDVQYGEKYAILEDIFTMGMFYPYENFCVLSKRHLALNVKDQRLHCDGAPAIEYADGFKIWSLNGVIVTQEIAETPAEKLDAKILLRKKNAQVRMEIIKKIGYDKILRDLEGELIDSWKEYELYEFKDIDVAPVVLLKMKCSSSGAWYTLRVPPDIKDCRSAYEWINFGQRKEDAVIET